MQVQTTIPTEVSTSGDAPFSTDTENVSAPSKEGFRCPDCSATARVDGASEVVCPKCDTVIIDEPITSDPRPQYGPEDRSKARAGSRLTPLYADRGLGTGVDRRATSDANGQTLSASQRRILRGKPWTKDQSPSDFRLDYALGEIRRMGEAFEIPTPELEQAARLYRQALTAGLLTGRSIEGFATASLLIAIRQSDQMLPVSQRELMKVSRAKREQFWVARKTLKDEFDVSIPPMEAHEFLPRAASSLAVPPTVRECARKLLSARSEDDDRDCRGISPRTLAASALHAAYDVVGLDERPTLTKLADEFDVARSTISQRKRLLTQYEEVWQ